MREQTKEFVNKFYVHLAQGDLEPLQHLFHPGSADKLMSMCRAYISQLDDFSIAYRVMDLAMVDNTILAVAERTLIAKGKSISKIRSDIIWPKGTEIINRSTTKFNLRDDLIEEIDVLVNDFASALLAHYEAVQPDNINFIDYIKKVRAAGNLDNA